MLAPRVASIRVRFVSRTANASNIFESGPRCDLDDRDSFVDDAA
jgi:hypothetical protein